MFTRSICNFMGYWARMGYKDISTGLTNWMLQFSAVITFGYKWTWRIPTECMQDVEDRPCFGGNQREWYWSMDYLFIIEESHPPEIQQHRAKALVEGLVGSTVRPLGHVDSLLNSANIDIAIACTWCSQHSPNYKHYKPPFSAGVFQPCLMTPDASQ